MPNPLNDEFNSQLADEITEYLECMAKRPHMFANNPMMVSEVAHTLVAVLLALRERETLARSTRSAIAMIQEITADVPCSGCHRPALCHSVVDPEPVYSFETFSQNLNILIRRLGEKADNFTAEQDRKES